MLTREARGAPVPFAPGGAPGAGGGATRAQVQRISRRPGARRLPGGIDPRTVNKKPLERVKDDTLILADQAEKAMSQLCRSVRKLLANNAR